MKKRPDEDTRTGRFLCLVLRHKPEAAGIVLDRHGWAVADELVAGVSATGRRLDRAGLDRIVREDGKRRYAFSADGTRVRAVQGHSVPVDLGLVPVEPPELLYHGTGEKAIRGILEKGILRMSRQYVHLSSTYETAVTVGVRHGEPVVLTVDAGAMFRDGAPFYLAENGVWLCGHVPQRYILV